MAGWPSQRATAKTSRAQSFTGHSIPAHLLHCEYKRWKWQFVTADLPVTLGTPELNVDVHIDLEIAKQKSLRKYDFSTLQARTERGSKQTSQDLCWKFSGWYMRCWGRGSFLTSLCTSGNNTNEVFVSTISVFMYVMWVHVWPRVWTSVSSSIVLTYWERGSHLNPEHSDSVSLASHLALGNLQLCLRNTKCSQVHPALLGVRDEVGLQTCAARTFPSHHPSPNLNV